MELPILDKNTTYGLAISGGSDSVFLAHMLNSQQINFVAIHCNYQLRGEESNKDASFVNNFCAQLLFCKKVIIKNFDTLKLRHKWGIGIQETARKIRYDFFDQLHNEKYFDVLLTAHHADDQVETFFLNLNRKSGLNGLSGIPERRDYIQRPLLLISKKEILNYLQSKQLKYRLDKSNEKNDYARNKIRNVILPAIEKEIPGFSNAVKQSVIHLNEDLTLLKYFINEVKVKCVIKRDDGFLSVDISELKSYSHSSRLLYEMLDVYGFSRSDCQQILQDNTKIGAQFFNKNYVMVKTNNEIEVYRNTFSELKLEIISEGDYKVQNGVFSIKKTKEVKFSDNPYVEVVNLSQYPFPLTLRYWQEEDFIIPLGMQGRKLLSDFFTDLKINPLKRKNIPLVAFGSEILWIIGYRISDKIKYSNQSELHQLKFEEVSKEK
jgi:tRNA(Ile)-lysidine synthase